MIRKGLLLVTLLALSLPLFAQDHSIGVLVGTSEFIEDSISLDFNLDVQEIWYSKDLEAGTALRLKLGQSELDVEGDDNELTVGDHDIEYGLALIEYRFDEIFGSTSLFLGPGAYRISTNAGDETDFGLSAGVAGDFPVTRRFGFVLEGAYHWVNFGGDIDFLTVGAGMRFGF